VFTNGFIPDEEVVNYFCAADLIVQPYRSATQSGVTQIAYHFERPMLVTNVGGLDEIVNDKTGYACSPISEEISNSIIDFYTNERESNFVSGIKSEKKKYSWNYMIENIKLLYNKIV
jgi:D-inositol-3-phosphate glycosyltransferase